VLARTQRVILAAAGQPDAVADAARLYADGGGGYGTAVGEAVAAAGGVHGFPAAPASFIGRAGPVRELAVLLEQCRLVTVTGPGGSGKTRLACEVAGRVAGRFADGAWLVELAPVGDPAQVRPGAMIYRCSRPRASQEQSLDTPCDEGPRTRLIRGRALTTSMITRRSRHAGRGKARMAANALAVVEGRVQDKSREEVGSELAARERSGDRCPRCDP
jgi:hypothetical protein